MKKLLAVLLALATLFSLVSCAGEAANETLTDEAVSSKEEASKDNGENKKEEKETKEEVVYDVVDTPLTPERVAALPIANENMSVEELRQLCVDYVKLSVSFQWVPNMDFYYDVNQTDAPVNFKEGKLHGGIPYINYSSGNLYRMLEFYDTKTGILDVEYLSRNTRVFGTACSGTTGWGWNRVINSAVCGWTKDLNASHGLIPVGEYTYDLNTTSFGTDGYEDCKDIAHRSGEQVMFRSYGKTLAGDCIVNNGHVRMIAGTPEIFTNEDGTINGEQSRVLCVEQGLFTTGEYHKRVSADGTPYVIQGNDGKYYTFNELYESGYLPHTFKEFLGQDPIEPGAASTSLTGDTVSVDQLCSGTFTANYAVSDIRTIVTDENGNELLNYAWRSRYHFHRNFELVDVIPRAAVLPLQAAGTNTVTLTAQLGNGEIVEAFSARLAG